MNIGDDVTINGVIIKVTKTHVVIGAKSGSAYRVWKEDINTIRPQIVIPDKDERRGN